jgi:hypothetical protein
VSFIGLGISFIGLGVGYTGLIGLIELVELISFILLVSLVNFGGISLVSLMGLIGSHISHGLGLVGLIGLIGYIGLNDYNDVVDLINNMEFEIPCYSFLREGWLWCVRRLSSLAGLDSGFFFGHRLQYTKQLFYSRILQMTKYFVMRECEYIPTRNIYAVTQHLLTRGNVLFFNSLRGFWRSLVQRSHSFIHFISFIDSI